MAQIKIHLATAWQRPAQVVVVGHRRATQGQQHHQGAAQAARQRRAQTGQQGAQAAQYGCREQHDPLHEQRGQGQAYPVEARRHRLGEHQHQYQQLSQQHHAQQGFRLAQFGDEEVVDGGAGFVLGKQLCVHRRSFRVALRAGKPDGSSRTK